MNEYICKIASIDEMNKKWDYEINKAEDKENWIVWKEQHINRVKNGFSIAYYGILNGQIISECTANINNGFVQNSDGLVDDTTAYLGSFRTIEEYQGKGYFSKLFKFMIEDLKKRGYKKVTLGVEPHELKNKAIYTKYGFTEHIKNAKEYYPDGSEVEVEYYGRNL